MTARSTSFRYPLDLYLIVPIDAQVPEELEIQVYYDKRIFETIKWTEMQSLIHSYKKSHMPPGSSTETTKLRCYCIPSLVEEMRTEDKQKFTWDFVIPDFKDTKVYVRWAAFSSDRGYSIEIEDRSLTKNSKQ